MNSIVGAAYNCGPALFAAMLTSKYLIWLWFPPR